MRRTVISLSILVGIALALPTSKVDPRQAASLGLDRPTEEQLDGFLSQFMGVQDGPEQSNAIPEADTVPEVAEKEDTEEPDSKSYGRRRKKSRKSSKSRHGGNDDHDEHEGKALTKAATDCRFRIVPGPGFETPVGCIFGGDIAGCFWDAKAAVCNCPRTEKQCSEDKLSKKQCFWHTSKKSKRGYKKDGKKEKKETEDEEGMCMHNSERFYNILSRLLAKRGKKDLSLQIHYSSAPAKGKLPYGPYGPAIVGYGDEFEKAYDRYEEEARNYDHRRPYDSSFSPHLPYGLPGYGLGGFGRHGYGFGNFRSGYGYNDHGFGYDDDRHGYGHDDHDDGYGDDHHDGGYDDDDYGYEPDYPPFYPPYSPYASHFASQVPPYAGHFDSQLPPLFGQHDILNPHSQHPTPDYPSPYAPMPYGPHPAMPYNPVTGYSQPQCNCHKQDHSAGSGYSQPSYGGGPATAYSDPAVPAYPEPAVPTYPGPAVPAYPEPAVPAYQEPAAPAYPEPAVPAYPEPAAPAYPDPTVPAYPEATPPKAVYPEPAVVYPEPAEPQYQVPYSGPPQVPSYSPSGPGYAQSYSQPLSSQSYNPFFGPPTHSLPYYG